MKVDNGAYGVKDVNVDYPANSHTVRAEKKQPGRPPKVEKIITGHVIKKKKSFGKKIVEAFFSNGEDVDNVAGYVIHDVLIPAAKSTISDMVSDGIEMLMYGEVRHGHRSRDDRDRNRSYVSYDNYSRNDRDRDSRDRREFSYQDRARHNFDDIILGMRGEAEDVLNHLVDQTIDYGMVTVADLYDLVGIEPNYTDDKYGWTNLSTAKVIRVRDGYLIDLPKPRLLD